MFGLAISKNLPWNKIIIGIVIAGFILYGITLYYDNKYLEERNQNVETAIYEQNLEMQGYIYAMEEKNEVEQDVDRIDMETRAELDDFRNKFTESEIDFEQLLKSEPAMLEKIINEGTQRELKCLEKTTRNSSC